MHDFRFKKASDMKFDILRNRVKYFKEKGGRDSMCKSVEEYGKKVAKEAAKKEKDSINRKTIVALLNKGMSTEWIHDTLELPIELIQQIQNSLTIKK